MRFVNARCWALCLLLISVVGCSKPESKLVGKWRSDKTSTTMEFNDNKTGVIHPSPRANLPPNLTFRWTLLNDDLFKVEVNVPGSSSPPAGVGKLESGDTFVLEDDTFKKIE